MHSKLQCRMYYKPATTAMSDLMQVLSTFFSFGSPYAISSVSTDGIELPKVYFTSLSSKQHWLLWNPIKT